MPEMDGIQLITNIKKSSNNFRSPILIISGYIDKNIERLAQLNIIKIIPKTTKIEDIISTISANILPNTNIKNQNTLKNSL